MLSKKKKKGNHFDYIIILQPTCPLRTASEIDQSLELLISSKSDSIVSVYQVDDEHPGRMYNIVNNNLKPLFPSLISLNRENCLPFYHRNGCIYAVKTQIVKSGSLFGNRVLPDIEKENSVNIDNEIDWKIAEILINEQKKIKKFNLLNLDPFLNYLKSFKKTFKKFFNYYEGNFTREDLSQRLSNIDVIILDFHIRLTVNY